MPIEKTKSTDTVASGLIAKTGASERGGAGGVFTVTCFDKDGNLKWEEKSHNLVVNVGLEYMNDAALGGGSQITTWYIGLYGAAASNSPAAGNTMLSHSSWTEVTAYDETTRRTCTFGTPTIANPSVITNSASTAEFTMNATTVVGGAFLTSDDTKGGTIGTLFSAADFQSPGDRSVVDNDILRVTYTFSLTGT